MWKSMIPKCFGAIDHVWGGHPNDEQRIHELWDEARSNGVSRDDLTDAIVDYITTTLPENKQGDAIEASRGSLIFY